MIDFPVSFTSKEITPWGGMAFLKQMLDKMQFSDVVGNCCSLPAPGSNRGYDPKVILESFIASIWCVANRFMHTELTRLDPALARIFGWKQMPAQEAYKRYFSKFSQITNLEVSQYFYISIPGFSTTFISTTIPLTLTHLCLPDTGAALKVQKKAITQKREAETHTIHL